MPKNGPKSRLAESGNRQNRTGRHCVSAAQSSSCIEFFHRFPAPAPAISDWSGATPLHHLEATFTVTLLFARLESSCGETVWTEAVFAISWATPDTATVSVIVA